MEHRKRRFFTRFSRLSRGAAIAYPLALLALSAALLWIGERHWLTAWLLYVPRVVFAAPLLLITPALLLAGAKKLLWTQIVALLLTVGPLMGLVLPWPTRAAGGPTLELLSYNVDTAHAGADKVLRVVDHVDPDLVMLQEAPWHGPLHDGLRARFPYFDSTSQFILASRYPILERTAPKAAAMDVGPYQGLHRFMRYVVDSPLGKLAVYNLHPVSPRGKLGVERARRILKRRPTPRQDGNGDPEVNLATNAAMREAQIAEAAALAQNERYPVLLAGDTNLPGLSAALHRHLGRYEDGFNAAGSGFGYTFPARRPFLRLDRILVGSPLGFGRFRHGCPGASDHCWVSAQLFRRR
jgi:vancomycin resistance protein VanJ